MSAAGKRGADRLHIVGVVVVGICGAVLTYVSIVALEAFYMNDTTAADLDRAHESPNSLRNTVRAAQLTSIGEYRNGAGPDQKFIPIERAMDLVVADARRDPSLLVPGIGPSRTPNMMPQYGRAPVLVPTPATPAPVPPADGTAPATPAPVPTSDGTAPATAPDAATQPATAPAQPATAPAQPAQPAAGGNAP